MIVGNKIVYLNDSSKFSDEILSELIKIDNSFISVIISYRYRNKKTDESYISYIKYKLMRAIKNSFQLKKAISFYRVGKRYKVLNGGKVNSDKLIKVLTKINPDYIMICGGGVLSDEIINIPYRGIINVHPGILPYARGLDVLYHSIINKYPIGVTAHFIDQGIDTGDIILRKLVNIEKNDSFKEIKSKLNHTHINLYLEIFKKILSKDLFDRFKQKEKFKYCNKITKKEKQLALDILGQSSFLEEYLIALKKYKFSNE